MKNKLTCRCWELSVILSSRLRTSSNSCAFFFFSNCWLCFRLATFLFWSFICLRIAHTHPLVLMTAITSFAIEINFVTTTQDIDFPTETSIPSISCNNKTSSCFQDGISKQLSDYIVVQQLFRLTRFSPFHDLLTKTHTYSELYAGKLLKEGDYPTILTHSAFRNNFNRCFKQH